MQKKIMMVTFNFLKTTANTSADKTSISTKTKCIQQQKQIKRFAVPGPCQKTTQS